MNKIKILYLEDLPADVELVRRELKNSKMNFELLNAVNKKSFVDALKDFSPDVILSDHSLPSFDSHKALKIIKDEKLKIPFILITATVSEEFAVKIIKDGAEDYILKDRLHRLPTALLNAIEKARIEDEREKYFNKIISSEAIMKEAERLSHFGSWQYEVISGKIKWSDEIYRIFGYEPGEFEPTYEKFLSDIHPDDRPFVFHQFDSITGDIESFELTFRIQNKNGLIKYVKNKFKVTKSDKGEPALITGFMMDITDAEIAEMKLKQSEASYREFFESAPEAIFIMDAETRRITDFNAKAIELFNYSEKEMLDKIAGSFSPEFQSDGTDSKKMSEVLISKTLSGEKPVMEWTIRDADGRYIPCDLRMVKIINQEKTYIRTSLVDITERKNAELERDRLTADLIRQNKNFQHFAYIVSHNLRAPLTNIMGYSDVLINIDMNDEEKMVLQKELYNSAEKLDDVIKDLNNILHLKNVHEKTEHINFAELLEDVKHIISNIIRTENAQITGDFEEVEEIFSTRTYLHSIFLNLITNSIKYKRADVNPVIEIKSFKLPGKVVLQFKDNGLGIDMNRNGQQLFGLYKRFHGHPDGKGLGLFMVKTQVESLNGKISVQSEVNKGTQFTMEFET